MWWDFRVLASATAAAEEMPYNHSLSSDNVKPERTNRYSAISMFYVSVYLLTTDRHLAWHGTRHDAADAVATFSFPCRQVKDEPACSIRNPVPRRRAWQLLLVSQCPYSTDHIYTRAWSVCVDVHGFSWTNWPRTVGRRTDTDTLLKIMQQTCTKIMQWNWYSTMCSGQSWCRDVVRYSTYGAVNGLQ